MFNFYKSNDEIKNQLTPPQNVAPSKVMSKRPSKIESKSSFLIEEEEDPQAKSSIKFNACLIKLVIFLINNSTSMPNKYSPSTVKLNRGCQCLKCTPNLYEISKMPQTESFMSADNFQSFHSGNGSENSSSQSSINEEDQKRKMRRATLENLRSIRKIILMMEFEGIDCKICFLEKTLINLKDVKFNYF